MFTDPDMVSNKSLYITSNAHLLHVCLIVHPSSCILPHAYLLMHTSSCIPPHALLIMHTSSCILPHAYLLMHTSSCIPHHAMHTSSCILPHAYLLMHTSSCIPHHAYLLMHTSSCILPHAYFLMHTSSCILPHAYFIMHKYAWWSSMRKYAWVCMHTICPTKRSIDTMHLIFSQSTWRIFHTDVVVIGLNLSEHEEGDVEITVDVNGSTYGTAILKYRISENLRLVEDVSQLYIRCMAEMCRYIENKLDRCNSKTTSDGMFSELDEALVRCVFEEDVTKSSIPIRAFEELFGIYRFSSASKTYSFQIIQFSNWCYLYSILL